MKIFQLFLAFSLILPSLTLAQELPASPGTFSLQASLDSAVLSWQNPEAENLASISLFSSTIPIEEYFSYEAVHGFCDLAYQGLAESFVAQELAVNLPYYFIIFADYQDGSHSRATVIEKKVGQVDEINAPKTEEKNNVSLAGADSERVNEVSFTEAGIVYNYNQKTEAKDDEAQRLSLFIMVKSPHDLSDKDKNAISYFVSEGTPTTIILGAGERTGVLNSYLSAFEKLPRNVLEWQDVIKIANGRWPSERKPEVEKEAADTSFSAIYARQPDLDDPNDSAAVTVIAYGLRPAGRNMESEAKAVEIYRNIFKKDPVEAFEWDLVRAIAYSGATR
jgi:hypothetical protein